LIDPLEAAVVRETTQQLIRIPSINPTLAPEGKGESAIATFARDWNLRPAGPTRLASAVTALVQRSCCVRIWTPCPRPE